MANTISESMMVSEAPSTTQLAKREVADMIRFLGIGRAKLTALVDNVLYKDGNRRKSKGLIGRRHVNNVRYEMYTRSPRPRKFTVTSGTEISSSGLVMTSVNGLNETMTLYNPRTDTRCRVESIDTLTIKGSSFGATTFSAAAGDELTLMAPAVKEGSTATMVINGSDDQNFNTLQFSRWGVSISWVLDKIKQLAGGKRLTREEMYLLWEALEDQEATLLFSDYTGDYATKNTTTGQQTGYTGEYPTTKGLKALAANSGTAHNNGDLSFLRKDLPALMGNLVNDDDMYIAFCSNTYYGEIVDEQDKKHQINENGELKAFGIKSDKIITAGPNIQLVKHNAFNTPALQGCMLVFAPANVGYIALEGHDVKSNNGIQTNATHGKVNELYGYYGFETKDAGNTITWVTDLL